jgi:glutathione S-transferase
MPDQSIIDQSLDIMDWALHQPDARNYLPDDEESKLFTRKWIMANDDSFKHLLDAYKYPERYVEITQENSLACALETYLLPLNQLLVQQPFLLGGYFQLVDLAIFPFIRQFAMVDLERFKQLPLPNLQKWLNFFIQSELFEQVMTKYSLWIDPK